MKRKRNYIILILAILFVVFASILFINRKIKINPLFAAGYEIRGVDVSHYQGTIDWDRLAEQDIDFAFIKATEGSSYLDECFYDNLQAAEKTNLYIGAYHFFSFDSEGEKQAEFYIETVGDLYGKLAPVIDVEFYGDKESNPPKKEEVVAQLGKMLTVLEEHYQAKPVIYTTYKVYNSYIKGEFEEYPLWIRNVYYPPVDVLGGKWSFWQYTDTAVLEGYKGDEKYIDMNVFNGTKEKLEELVVRCADEPESSEVYGDSDEKDMQVKQEENSDNKNVLQTLNVDLEEAELIVTDSRYSSVVQWGYADIESFLKDFGFDNEEPFYRYYEEDSGGLQLELYYDTQTGRGCGIRYYPGTDWKPEGFAFNGSDKNIGSDYEAVKERMNADPDDTLAKGGVDLSQDMYIEDYEEELEYTSDGRLKHYKAQGWITYSSEEKEIQKLLEITLTYREDGTLKQRDYAHNTLALETWESVSHSFYDKQERLVYEDCYITHGSMDYYYIYNENETIPSYCLIMDHDLNLLCTELLSIHDIIADEDGKQYGVVGPDLSDNSYVKSVRTDGDYESDKISHTYENDYDGDGYQEAFVIIGDCMDFLRGEATENQISGDLWFVDHDQNTTRLDRASFRAWQEYISQDGETYLFLHHDIGLPWRTDIYTVQENEPVICREYSGSKYLNEDGQVIQIQDAYDGSHDASYECGWSGHTWKPYTFEFDHGELKEIPAKEMTREEVKKIAALTDDFDEKKYESVQYILRENGELNVNVAEHSSVSEEVVHFKYFTYYANENGEWELTDEGPGIYKVQLYENNCWDYLEKIESEK